MKHFAYDHLPEHLQKVSAPICQMAEFYDDAIPDSAEKTAGLRKLLEAKDCLVRAALTDGFNVTGQTVGDFFQKYVNLQVDDHNREFIEQMARDLSEGLLL
ncbi:MAG: hypothetical protein KI788_03930 [Mameliella sp.]|nr:hypothetical protein [Mameliella sp.]